MCARAVPVRGAVESGETMARAGRSVEPSRGIGGNRDGDSRRVCYCADAALCHGGGRLQERRSVGPVYTVKSTNHYFSFFTENGFICIRKEWM